MKPISSCTARSRLTFRVSRVARYLVFSVLALLLSFGGAVAAEDVVEEGKEQDGVVKLQAVKVTANKMEEDPMDVPQNITVINELDIEEKGITDIRDVIDMVPGMSHSKDHGTAVNFRGLNASMFTQNNPVALYIDGVGQSSRYGFDTSLVNVERVEVLHGPQSTLYGKDAMGAVINVVSKNPTNEFDGKVGAEYGSWNYGKAIAGLNGPLIQDNLFFGFGAQVRREDGWIKNDYSGLDDDANRKRQLRGNGYLLWTPETLDDLSVRLAVRYDEDKHYHGDEYSMGAGKSLSSFDASDAKHISYDVDTWTKVVDNTQTAKVDYAFSAVKVNSITVHKTQDIKGQYDSDFSDSAANLGLEMFDENDMETWSQEFRFSSPNDKGFRWTGGFYVDTETRNQGPYGQQMMSMGTPWEYDAHSKSHSKTQAVFGQVMIPMLEKFELTLGGRVQRIKKDIDLSMFMTNLNTNATMLAYEMEAEKTENAVLPKAALSYDITDNWTTYVSYSHGYMPGGFNSFATGGTVDDNSFKPEKSINYEWGVKAAYDNFRMSADLFYMDIEDIHVYKTVGLAYVTDNAKKAHSQGVEFQATYLPIDTVELTGAFSIIDARYDDYDAGTTNFDGERVEQTPSYSIMLGAAYHAPCGIYARANARHYGTREFFNSAASNFTTADAYTVVDSRIGYQFNDFDAYAYVNNLFNEEYVTAFRANSLASIVGVGEPRSLGIGVTYHF